MANILLEEVFYPGEAGFSFSIKTGIDMSNLLDGEIKGVVGRPNGSVVARTIPLAKVFDAATGSVYFDIEVTDFTEPGEYTMQIFTKDADGTLVRPSHLIRFEVQKSIVDAATIFV
ncbi:MAG: hypothetical protein KAJ19_20590 [Gammaproteobacteria bacterium]|nr:hypothetical protein [Gammaproteobacteria bacterium]